MHFHLHTTISHVLQVRLETCKILHKRHAISVWQYGHCCLVSGNNIVYVFVNEGVCVCVSVRVSERERDTEREINSVLC